MDLIVKTSGVARKRSYGNEKRDFGEDGLMIRRRSSINAPPINAPPINDPLINDPLINDPLINDPPINDPLVNAPPIKVAGRKFHWLQKS
ncbi:hypothetical protein DBL07_08630 [Achromobacter mucicolens]|nr:hypothetical protein DBL07_08630 [Achromobacter mucicolens]